MVPHRNLIEARGAAETRLAGNSQEQLAQLRIGDRCGCGHAARSRFVGVWGYRYRGHARKVCLVSQDSYDEVLGWRFAADAQQVLAMPGDARRMGGRTGGDTQEHTDALRSDQTVAQGFGQNRTQNRGERLMGTRSGYEPGQVGIPTEGRHGPE